ncbi:TfoX/Sxy family protein [Spongiimicrobium sp. 2-473A-2-J]|uniref:TfoX/Sxy family protein n=1 Tax=Eudoraea algarum TaxID=3417568 RepID=UPI003D370093
MAYDEALANRIRAGIKLFPENFTEKKMFGGLSFLYQGKMTVGVVKEELAVRVVAEKMDAVLKMDAVRPMDFTKRPMKEFIYVATNGFDSEEQLHHWIELGLEHAKSKL